MVDSAITDYTEKTTVDGEELIEVADLRESAAADQNKKITIDTIMSSIWTYEGDVLTYGGDVLYSL